MIAILRTTIASAAYRVLLDLDAVERSRARFEKHISPCPITGCHWWMAGAGAGGYGRFRMPDGPVVLAPRFAWTLANGPIPEGLDVDHLCFQPTCVNALHLEAVTPEENNRRRRPRALVTQCPRGHDLADAYVRAGKRSCRVCTLAKANAYYAANREAVLARSQAIRDAGRAALLEGARFLAPATTAHPFGAEASHATVAGESRHTVIPGGDA